MRAPVLIRPDVIRTLPEQDNTLQFSNKASGLPALAVLLQANSRIAAVTATAVEILGMWFKTVLDDGKRSALKYFTLVSPPLCLSLDMLDKLQG